MHILGFLCISPIHMTVILLNVNHLLQDKNPRIFYSNI